MPVDMPRTILTVSVYALQLSVGSLAFQLRAEWGALHLVEPQSTVRRGRSVMAKLKKARSRSELAR
jgi:hypothetical protein